MDKKYWLLGICLSLLGFVIGGFVFGSAKHAPDYIPTLKVVGDVAENVTLKDLNAMGKPTEITYQGVKYQAIKLADIINAAKPVAKASQLYLAGSDGFTSSIKADGIEKCYIAFTAKNGWEAINLNHPVNSNAKMLKEIIVVSDGSSGDFGIRVTNQETELLRVTPGQLYTRAITEYPYFEGEASAQNGGNTYESSVYTKRRVFELDDLISANGVDMILVTGENSEPSLLDNRGYFELKENYINYLQPDTRNTVEKVKSVKINPPT